MTAARGFGTAIRQIVSRRYSDAVVLDQCDYSMNTKLLAYRFAAKLPIINSARWPFGKIEVFFAYDFRRSNKAEYEYLTAYYPNHCSLYGNGTAEYFYQNFHFFNSVRENDRLDIISHANEHGMGRECSAEKLASELHRYSLRKVGVIKFQGCELGKGLWLEKARDAFLEAGISFAYMAAPIGRIHWLPPFKYANGERLGERYRVIKGNIDRNFPGTRYTTQAHA